MDLNSIRNRYALLSILGGCVVVIAAGLTNFVLNSTRQEAADHIQTRQNLLSHSRVIRNEVWNAREALGHFLIDPLKVENQNLIHNSIGGAINSTKRLLENKEQLNVEQYKKIRHMLDSILELDQAAVSLIDTRLSAQTQYPSLSHATRKMLPKQRAIINQLNYAISETSEQLEHFPESLPLYQLLIEIRHKWSSTILGVRMLIASRIGSFGNESLMHQISNIDTFLTGLNVNLEELNGYLNYDYLGLATEEAINEINVLIPKWDKSYRQLLKIHASDEWRGDIRHLRQEIDPLLDEIWNTLISFDSNLSKDAEKDVSVISTLAENQSYIIWSIASLGVVFILIGFFALDRYLLTPISSLTQALFKEAHGEKAVDIPKVNSTETKDLLSAFHTMRDLVRQRQNALEHQAMHDDLTNLPNRTLLYEKLNSMVSKQTRKNDHHILIIMDLDRFKEVNDSLGHHIGDELLMSVSVRLRHLLRDTDLVARLGGDEFSILLPDTNEREARQVARKILKAFESPYQVNEHELYVGASMGLATYPHHGLDAETLIKRADTAMYVAKRNRLGYTFYEGLEDQDNELYLSLASDLRAAVRNEELQVFYQLKYDLQTNLVVGAEALLRWTHPKHGNVSPAQIIPIAEQLGLINKITLQVLEEAIKQCRGWRDQGLYLSVSVNLSVYDLQSSDIVNHIDMLLKEYDIPPSYLIIEITEGAMLIEPQHAIEILRKLDTMGIRIAIDDFGTGYSSLGYLKQLPVDELKIDKSFVMDMIHDENDAVIVRSTIDLAHNLGLQVVAEGVESAEIYQLLEALKCDTAQGFYMCKPVPAEQIHDYLIVNVRQISDINHTDRDSTGTI